MRHYLFAAAVVIAIAAPVGADDEKPVKESEAPKPVLETVKKKYPAATVKGIDREEEDGKVSYEVKIEVKEKEKTRSIEVICSPEGKIEAEEEKIAESDVPEVVRKGLARSKYAKWTVKKVERIVKEEKESEPSFEYLLVEGDEKFEVVFDNGGKITEEEDKSPKKKKSEKEDD